MVENKDLIGKNIEIPQKGVEKVAKATQNAEIITNQVGVASDVDAKSIKIKAVKTKAEVKTDKSEAIVPSEKVKAAKKVAKATKKVDGETTAKMVGTTTKKVATATKTTVKAVSVANVDKAPKIPKAPKTPKVKEIDAVKVVDTVEATKDIKVVDKIESPNSVVVEKIEVVAINDADLISDIVVNDSKVTAIVGDNESDKMEVVVVTSKNNNTDAKSNINSNIEINEKTETNILTNTDTKANENVDADTNVKVDTVVKAKAVSSVASFFKKVANCVGEFLNNISEKAEKFGKKVVPVLKKIKLSTYIKAMAVVMAVILVFLIGSDMPMASKRKGVTIKVFDTVTTPILNPDGTVNETVEPEVEQIVTSTLRANLYLGSRVDGVILFGGLNTSQSKLKSLAKLYFDEGLTVMTVDLSGNGISGGVNKLNDVDYDNMIKEMDAVINEFTILTNLSIKNTILLGHSEGARGVLELLASKKIDDNFKMIYLLAPMVDYDNFVLLEDASLYTREQVFLNGLNNSVLNGTKTVLLPVYNDENFSASSTAELYKRLSGNAEYVEKTNNAFENLVIYNIKGVAHELIPYSSSAASIIKETLRMTLPLEKTDSTAGYTLKINAIIFSLLLLVGFLALINLTMKKKFDYENEHLVELSNTKTFLTYKPIYVAVGAVIGGVIGLLGLSLPFGMPASTLVFALSVSGYGIAMLIFFLIKKVCGATGKFLFNWKNCSIAAYVVSAVIVLGAVLYLSVLLNIGLYSLYPPNIRILYLVVFTVLMAVGFYFYEYESEMLTSANASIKDKAIYHVEVLIPIILLLLFNLFSGGFSSLLANILALVFLCVATFLGKVVKKMTNNKVVGAVAAAFVFCSVIISMSSMMMF